MKKENIEAACEKFAELIAGQEARIEEMKAGGEAMDFSKKEKIVIGIIPGDGIGPMIMETALKVVNIMLKNEIEAGKVELKMIPGFEVENRAKLVQAIPDESLEPLHSCDVILKGPLDNTSTKGIGSSVAAIRRELGLNINLRPVKNPLKGYDWVMFRENIEGAYIWGSKGIQVDDDLAVDFVVETKQQSEYVARTAFEYARKNGRKHVTSVTKSNVVKLTDGNFIKACRAVAEEYPEITYDERLVDITASKMADPDFTKNLEVLVLPNLYGDIISDVAAEVCGGVGTAGAANLGKNGAVFEAIHGTAISLIRVGRGEYANPSSLLRAVAMMMNHIGYVEKANLLDEVLDICNYIEKKLVVTTFPEDASCAEFSEYILDTLNKLMEERGM